MSRHSGLQRDILKLYKSFINIAKNKDKSNNNNNIKNLIEHEFKKNATNISKTNFQLIEHLLRQGNKQLKQLQNINIKNASTYELKKKNEK